MTHVRVTLVCRNFRSQTVSLSPALADRLGLKMTHSITLRFGQKTATSFVHIDPNLRSNDLSISQDLQATLFIANGLKLCIKTDQGVLTIGPAIGILSQGKSLSDDAEHLRARLHSYTQLRGAITLFRQSDIAWKNGTVNGLTYMENKGFIEGQWALPSMLFGGTNPIDHDIAQALFPIFGHALFDVSLPKVPAPLLEKQHVLPPSKAYNGPTLPKFCQFFAFLQKIQSKEWIIASLAVQGDLTTPPKFATSIDDFLINQKKYSETDCFLIKDNLSYLAQTVAQNLSKSGRLLGELYVKISISSTGTPSATVQGVSTSPIEQHFASMHPIQRHEARARPLYYAKALAGFPRTA